MGSPEEGGNWKGRIGKARKRKNVPNEATVKVKYRKQFTVTNHDLSVMRTK